MRKMKKTIATLACLGLAVAGVGAYNVTATQTAQADEEEVFACAGASIRLDSQDANKTGIRFRIKMKASLLETAGEVTALVMPTDLLGDGVLDVNDTDAQAGTLTDWQDFVNEDGTTDPTYKQAYAYISGMTSDEWNRPTTWRAYYMDGNTPVYSNQMERALSDVALSLENDKTETTERQEMAKNYIQTYTVTYDLGVRDTNGEWKTTTQEIRYGTELTESAPEAREDFEFLTWKTTKGADKLKEDGGKTIVTGNVTKEAEWLLTDDIEVNSYEDLLQYADVYDPTNCWEFSTPEDTTDLNLKVKHTAYAANLLEIRWKNIIVPALVGFDIASTSTVAKRASDGQAGTAAFQMQGNATIALGNLNTESFVYNGVKYANTAVAPTTVTGAVYKTNLKTYDAENKYCVLGDLKIAPNAVGALYDITFSKLKIMAFGNEWGYRRALSEGMKKDGENASSYSVSCFNWATPYVTEGVDERGAYVDYNWGTRTAQNWSSIATLTFNFDGITLNAGDKICIEYGNSIRWDSFRVNGTQVTTLCPSTNASFTGKYTYTVTEETVLNTVSIYGANNSYQFAFRVYGVYVIRAN